MMASEIFAPVNGINGQQGYGGAGDHGVVPPSSSHPEVMTNGASAESITSSNGPSKDQVGWYFVEQYYTTLSKSPEKIHLFYNKRSQFVYGVETEKVPVSVGQRAISERITELGIEDAKVRVQNVDTQESGRNILLQVIGEMSNKKAPHRKFVQTFVLAEQPNGYFVLNDIFRYIAEEDEEDYDTQEAPETVVSPPAQPATEPEIKTLADSDTQADHDKDVEIVDKKLEEHVADLKDDDLTAEVATASESAGSEARPVDDSTGAIETNEIQAEISQEDTEKPPTAEVFEPEAPQDPKPSPAPSPQPVASTPAQSKEPAAAPKPAAPKTWAERIAASNSAKVPVPVVPNIPVPAVALQQPKPVPSTTATASTQASSPAPKPTSSTEEPAQVPPSPGAGWQTAGQDHSKKQTRQQTAPAPEGNVLGYIKNVTSNVDAALLKGTLTKYGKLAYFDVSRPKNCAFVEFADSAGYNAAVAANPHSVNGEDIYVEERRPRPNAYGGGFGNRGGMRGGRGALEGRPPSQGGRGGYPKDNNRGGFVPRGRGGNAVSRGRGGAPQPA